VTQTIYADGGVVGRNPSEHGSVWAYCVVDDGLPGNNVIERARGLMVAVTASKWARVAADKVVSEQPVSTRVDIDAWPGSASVAYRTSNNHSELMAILKGLESRPPGWSGRVVSDSLNAADRFNGRSLLDPHHIPMEVINRMVAILARCGTIQWAHVKGHPSREDLKAGHRNGTPVSKHQVWCDLECTAYRNRWSLHLKTLIDTEEKVRRLLMT
jgi:ribonuclease HI